MDQTHRNHLLKELRRLKLAASDMKQVTEAADELADGRPVPRVLETGMITAYARSFTSGGRGWERFRRKWTPPAGRERDVHEAILHHRHKMHAHTDEKHSGRDIIDVFGHGTYAEEYSVLSLSAIVEIRELARNQQARFLEAAAAIEQLLAGG